MIFYEKIVKIYLWKKIIFDEFFIYVDRRRIHDAFPSPSEASNSWENTNSRLFKTWNLFILRFFWTVLASGSGYNYPVVSGSTQQRHKVLYSSRYFFPFDYHAKVKRLLLFLYFFLNSFAAYFCYNTVFLVMYLLFRHCKPRPIFCFNFSIFFHSWIKV